MLARRGHSVVRQLTACRSTQPRSASTLARARSVWGNKLVLAPEVEHALENGDAVVALESTIITHGMPHPVNLTTAQSLESILRSSGATPATVALLDGKVHIGLSQQQLEQLADPEVKNKVKTSRRDLAPALSKRLIGGTTVAGTMYLAQSVGVDMFVTGGIGGAHRGSENSMDISADLIELGRTPMAVVCAGAKSILDIPRTLEVLETQGVCVASYGQSHDFPAFYSPSSGQQSPWNARTPYEAASLIHAGLTLPHPLATLLAVPIPQEFAARGEQVQQAVEQAVKESIEQGIDKRGKEVTPWLLKRVGELTAGTALDLNVKLIENNARVGGAVAVELANLRRSSRESNEGSNASTSSYYSTAPPASISPIPSQSLTPAPSPSSTFTTPPRVLVFGSAAIDITSRTPHELAPRSTTPGEIDLTPGGVGRNIAEAASNALERGDVRLVSPAGCVPGSGQSASVTEVDTVGRVIMAEMQAASMRTDGLIVKPAQRSSACTLVLGKEGDLEAGVADMGIVESMTTDEIENALRAVGVEMVVHDCNPTEAAIGAILKGSYRAGIPTFCDPTSTPKLQRIVPTLLSLIPVSVSARRPLTHISPNVLELDVLHSQLTSDLIPESVTDASWEYINSLNLTADWRARVEAFCRTSPSSAQQDLSWLGTEGIVQKAVSLLPFFDNLWIKSGVRGLVRLSIVPIPSAGTSVSEANRKRIVYPLGGEHAGKALVLAHYAAPTIEDDIVSTTGAGDSLVGGLVAGLVAGKEEGEMVRVALEGVKRSLLSRRAVA